MLDAAGNVVLKRDGTPRTRTVVQRELQTTFTWNNFANFARAFGDEEVHKAVQVTAIFVIAAVATEIVLGLALAWLFNRQILGRPVLDRSWSCRSSRPRSQSAICSSRSSTRSAGRSSSSASRGCPTRTGRWSR